MSYFFVTLLCWDMAGDEGGWVQGLWVVILGVVMTLVLLLCDRLLLFGSTHRRCFTLDSDCPSLSQANSTLEIAHSLELVTSSLHHHEGIENKAF
jgi:hypothetical protein